MIIIEFLLAENRPQEVNSNSTPVYTLERIDFSTVIMWAV